MCDFAAGHCEQGEDGEVDVRKPTEQQNLEEKGREEDGEEGIPLSNTHILQLSSVHTHLFATYISIMLQMS